MAEYVRVEAVAGKLMDFSDTVSRYGGRQVGESTTGRGVRCMLYEFPSHRTAVTFVGHAVIHGARASLAEALPGYRQSDNDGDEAPPQATDGPDTDDTYGGGRCPTCGDRAIRRSTDDAMRWCSRGHRHATSSWKASVDTTDGMPEAVAQRRSITTRYDANRKARTSMDAKRRHTADIAKRWRSRNKSRAKGYQSVYNRPSLVHRESAEVDLVRLVCEAARRDPLDEARKTKELDDAFDALRRKTKGWVDEGWSRSRIIQEVDPSFVHHAEHFDRLLHGGVARNGRPFAGGGGLRWGGMVISEHEALLRVMGSFEYRPVQEVYQQTIRFANYRRIVEAEGFSWPEKARMLLLRDSLRVHCDCPAFKFWHQHAATEKGFALIPEDRAAPVNNPSERGGVCKHLNVALRWLGGQHARMASEMKQHHEGHSRE